LPAIGAQIFTGGQAFKRNKVKNMRRSNIFNFMNALCFTHEDNFMASIGHDGYCRQRKQTTKKKP